MGFSPFSAFCLKAVRARLLGMRARFEYVRMRFLSLHSEIIKDFGQGVNSWVS